MVKLIRWMPTAPHGYRTLDQVVDDLWRAGWLNPARYNTDTARPMLRPAMDVTQDETGVTIRVDLPGLTADDLTVEVDGDLLTISGEIKAAEEREGEQYHVRERCAGAFKRSLRLGEMVDVERIEATFENGVLTLAVPMRPEAQPKRIEVRTA
ncbi:MAG: Hsp20/alpha crystallin family protein [Chloroflexota bacterium]|jgi:HSP20 family protein